MLAREVADDGVALAQAEIAVVDHGHDADRVEGTKRGLIDRAVAAAPVLALEGFADLVEHPQNAAHVDRIGATINLDHRASPAAVFHVQQA